MADVEPAFAKINLALHVTGRRDDGFHELDSLVAFADIADRVKLTSSDADKFEVVGPYAAGLSGSSPNSVVAGLAAYRQWASDHEPGACHIVLEKNLPVASGIGGGSADCAALLRILAARDRIPLYDPDLWALAFGLGADVPACLKSRPLRMRGAGEQLEMIPNFPRCGILLVNPGRPVSTGEVFSRLARRENPGLPALPEKGFADAGALAGWLGATRNDLGPSASGIVPEIRDIETLLRAGASCRFARMSGSGASVFGLFDDETSAWEAGKSLAARHGDYWIKAGSLKGSAAVLPG